MSLIAYGCDPGTSSPGSALIRRVGSAWEILRLPVLSSLDDLLAELREILLLPKELRPTVVGYESVAWSLHAKNTGKGHGSGRILEAVGAVRLFASVLDVPAVELAPVTWRRQSVGSPRATKEQVRTALKRRVTGWPAREVSLNRSDAIAIAIAGGSAAAGQLAIQSMLRGAK